MNKNESALQELYDIAKENLDLRVMYDVLDLATAYDITIVPASKDEKCGCQECNYEEEEDYVYDESDEFMKTIIQTLIEQQSKGY